MTIRVTVDSERCIGAGECEFWAGEVFAIGPDAKAGVILPDSELEVHEGDISEAVSNCPVSAITVLAGRTT